MEKINYQKKLFEIISTLKNKPRLLLHSCCGPCSTQVISLLKDYFDITVYYYNPNIEPLDEYIKRKEEQIKFINEFNKKNNENIKFLDCDYSNIEFKKISIGLEKELEGGARCNKCFYLRLKKTAEKALDEGFAYFGTTLTVSPHKSSEMINKIGESLENSLKIPYIYGDFKKNNGYIQSIEYSKIYNLYRQNYCGCMYGKENGKWKYKSI